MTTVGRARLLDRFDQPWRHDLGVIAIEHDDLTRLLIEPGQSLCAVRRLGHAITRGCENRRQLLRQAGIGFDQQHGLRGNRFGVDQQAAHRAAQRRRLVGRGEKAVGAQLDG